MRGADSVMDNRKILEHVVDGLARRNVITSHQGDLKSFVEIGVIGAGGHGQEMVDVHVIVPVDVDVGGRGSSSESPRSTLSCLAFSS
jgi:hypothetical protein